MLQLSPTMQVTKIFYILALLSLTIIGNKCTPIGPHQDVACKVNGKTYNKGQVVLLSDCSGVRCNEQGDLSFFVDLRCSAPKYKRSAFTKRSTKANVATKR